MGTICHTSSILFRGNEDVSPGTALLSSHILLLTGGKGRGLFSHVFMYGGGGGHTNSSLVIKNINHLSLVMAVTKQAVRPLPGFKKVKQFNDIKKHQLTFLTCNGRIFTKHCNFSDRGANVNSDQHNDFERQYIESNRVRLVKTDVAVTTVYCILAG